jgi:hypothetical protein
MTGTLPGAASQATAAQCADGQIGEPRSRPAPPPPPPTPRAPRPTSAGANRTLRALHRPASFATRLPPTHPFTLLVRSNPPGERVKLG